MTWELAQVNVARLLAPLDDPLIADFVGALDAVNATADEAPGFVWRLHAEKGDDPVLVAFEWDVAGSSGVIVNMSVWTDAEHLAAFVYGDMHRQVLRRRREWFHQMREAWMACWWVPAGHRPTTHDAEQRIRHLRAHGPTPFAFTLRQSFPMPGISHAGEPAIGSDNWFCSV